ncbi:CPCC family cysteine-rich protein [Mechercharimyces sp. CAU 1602]|uniref:CPCC family cysteine-rich protein n=1 Tax=Mechercharimyces sp. CAU 1602 TaxID=2973933 RepID=UPI0021635389|nr:CPCC family cysteine-rich protein [Mechercharimyces sp. CAU 1602]
MKKSSTYPCPCCDFLTLSAKPPGTFEVCPVCYWEDDTTQYYDMTYTGGANKVSLIQGYKNYMEFKAIEERFVREVRRPNNDEIPLPEYANRIIVLVKYKGGWNWYVSLKEMWFLDYAVFPDENTDYSQRFHIAVVNDKTLEDFLDRVSDYKVSTSQLREFVNDTETKIDRWDLSDLFPSLFVDFDNKHLYSWYPEPASFEHYVPKGWKGDYVEFFDQVPENKRYWIIDGKDFLKV